MKNVRHKRLLRGAVVLGGAVSMTLLSAGAAQAMGSGTSATFTLGVLVVTGDAQNNTIVIGRNNQGRIQVNGSPVQAAGGQPTITNTRLIIVSGGAGNDNLRIDDPGATLPQVNLFGGTGNDTLTGGPDSDMLAGQTGADTLLGMAGFDSLFGGGDNDTLTGGAGDDQVFGESGDDRLVWLPGDGTDLNEGGGGTDTTEVVGGNVAEQFTLTANGTRVRFDRLNPAPFSIDMGTVDKLLLNANGGDDSFSSTGNLAAFLATVDGGAGNDTLLGSNGPDTLLGGAGNDFVDGQQGNDVAVLGSEDDTFQWDPGDGNDTVEGGSGFDTMLFNGSDIGEVFDVTANGERVRFFRSVASITMDLDDVEKIDLKAFGGADKVTVNDLAGTDLREVATDLAAREGGDDLAADNVVVHGTNGSDVVLAASQGTDIQVAAPSTMVAVTSAFANDTVSVTAGDGDDVVDASGVAVGSAALILTGDAGDDVLIGGDGDDKLSGGDGDDVLIGGPGNDLLNGGSGDNILIQGEILFSGVAAEDEWLTAHCRTVDGKTVIDLGDREVTVPSATLVPTS